MVVVIFEFETEPSLQDRYFEIAAELLKEVKKIEGFISVERFENIHQPSYFVSISTWETMESVKTWKEYTDHFAAQKEAKDSGIFKHYRIRVTEVARDYSSSQGTQFL